MRVALVAALGTFADAGVLCQRRGGQLALRDRSGPRGEPGPPGPPGSPTVCTLPRLLDAANADVGTVLTLGSSSAEVLREHDGQIYFVTVTPSGFSGYGATDEARWVSTAVPYYPSSTCDDQQVFTPDDRWIAPVHALS